MYPSGGRAFAVAARRRRPNVRIIAFFIVVTPPTVAFSIFDPSRTVQEEVE
jgi:flavin reductase (DIM6/NTAB) family NADH-FMN oxidoreductase RutF